MSAHNTQADLPHIPSLPPLEMPTSSFLTSSETTDSPCSVLTDASAEPFDGNNADRTSPTPSMLAPPTGLRKSISVDSFIQHKLVPGRTSRIRVNAPGPCLVAASEGVTREGSPRQEHFPSTSVSHSRPDQDHHTSRRSISTRQRGISVSAVASERYYTTYEDSDGERSEDLRRNAGKGKSVSRQTVPEGELTLPSRLPNPLPPSTAAPEPIVPERSSSLTHKLTKPRSLMSVNTHLLPPKYSHHRPEVTIAVIGTRGCGKSAVIRKGLKAYGLSEAKSQHDPESSTSSIPYTLRVGKIPHGGNVPDSILRVMEIDLLPSDDMENRLTRLCSNALAINGTVLCFDVTDMASFTRIESVIRALDRFKLPSIVLACKSGTEHSVNLDVANSVLHPLDVGLVDITAIGEVGKGRLRDAFELILKLASKANDRSTPRNPASPALVTNPGPAPWDISRADSATPTASSTMQAAQSTYTQPQGQSSAGGSPRMPPAVRESSHSPPARARSMSDLLSEQDVRRRDSRERKDSQWEKSSYLTSESGSNGRKEGSPQRAVPVRAPPWVSLDDLLDKLLFVGVSDDDPVFVNHFFLTYRRFTTPRSILLAMQKRMRSLDQPTGDPMFACFAQMKICCLLDNWMRIYRDDFAVPGTAGAFSALIKSILGKTYLLHYGSEFIPFMEILPTLKDNDAFWAIKVEAPEDDSDEDASSIAEPPPETVESASLSSISSHSLPTPPEIRNAQPPPPPLPTTRERKSSLPLGRLTVKDNLPPGFKDVLSRLKTNAKTLEPWGPAEIAQEINRVECDYFLKIRPRHWLQHVFAHGKKKTPKMDTITHFNWVSNHIGKWVTSIILSYDKPKARARQIEKFADVANRLRIENNYSGLRAVVAGINGATYEGDLSIEIYRAKNPSSWKALQSFDQLLQSVRSHQKYRMALRNTKGACIPALEIHLSDLIRAHEGNPDFHDDDPAKIHWAKFNMMGRFIDTISQCQKACEDTGAYYQPYNATIYQSFCIETPNDLMSEDMQTARHPPPDIDGNNLDTRGLDLPRSIPRDSLHHAVREGGGPLFKKIFFW